MLLGLGARVHLFVRPEKREDFTRLFRDVLNCNVVERDFGMRYPILLVSFGDGSAFSVEFSDEAPTEYVGLDMNDQQAFRGAWIEFRTNDLPAIQDKLINSGIRHFRHPGSPHIYFSAPGGQVFRVLDASYRGP